MANESRRGKTQLPPLDRAELKKMAPHLGYEFDQFHTAFASWGGPPVNQQELNVIIEQALLHLRVLLGFFSDRTYPDDVIASDFVCGWKTEEKCLRTISSCRDALNKRLAHFSRERLTHDSFSWPREKLHDAMEAIIRDFELALKQHDPELYEHVTRTSERQILAGSVSNSTL